MVMHRWRYTERSAGTRAAIFNTSTSNLACVNSLVYRLSPGLQILILLTAEVYKSEFISAGIEPGVMANRNCIVFFPYLVDMYLKKLSQLFCIVFSKFAI